MSWKNLRRLLATAIALYALVVVFINYVRPLKYTSCELYTKEMNGGIRSFKGKTYNVVLCGWAGLIDPDNIHDDEVRLQIFSADGDLLAQRYFEFYWNLRELEYGDDYLIYNDGEGSGFQTRMTMPPNLSDRMLARLPRLMP